jgi:hypothetical protein
MAGTTGSTTADLPPDRAAAVETGTPRRRWSLRAWHLWVVVGLVLLFLVPPWVGARRQSTWDDQVRAACTGYVVDALGAQRPFMVAFSNVTHAEPLYTVTGELVPAAGAAHTTLTCQAVHREDDVFDVSGVTGLPR